MKAGPARAAVAALVVLTAACGGGVDDAEPSASAPPSTATTIVTPTTVDPISQVEALQRFPVTVDQYMDLLSALLPVLELDGVNGGGIPASDLGGAFGGTIAPGAALYVLGTSISDSARGAVAVIDVSDGTIPTRFVGSVLGNLTPANTNPLRLYESDVLPALSNIDENVQRFNLGSVSLEMTYWATGDLVFAFVANGDEVPALVDALH